VVSHHGEIRSNVISSQGIHDRYGGVVPEIASRHHLELTTAAVDDALARAEATLDDLDLVAVTQGPGLVGALLVGVVAGVGAGRWCAAHPRSAARRIIEAVAMFFLCAPVYVVGLSLLLTFGTGIAVSGIGFLPLKYVPFADDPAGWLGSMITPWIVLGLPLAAVCERMMNSSIREVLHEEYVRTALAKGISQRRMLRRHAVPAAVAPVFTLAGVTVPVMITNMVLVELTFSIPGVYQTIRASMDNADFPVIQGTVIATACLVALATLVVDVALAWLDPKIRTAA
jgi:peptide/nickel transport system permease protein